MASLYEGTGYAHGPSHSGTSSPSLPPTQLSGSQHYLLSPVPASQASSSSSSKPGATGTTGTSGPDSTTSVTLYPLEPVPPHLLCAICTLPYENPVHFLPCCHVFCLECIQLWIGMNLSDDLLQNELRRAYPAGDDLVHASSFSEEPLTFELSRMGDRSRSGTSGALYDSYSGLPPMAQVHQRQVAIILENREMPKCPMCRTGLHIHAWDRIEEQIKVPISVGPRPQSTPSTEWFDRNTNQRPVSGVQRRRLRSDRHLLNGRRGLGRQDSIGEEDEDEEIEMEHVGTRGQDVSPSPSSFGRHPPRRERINPSQQHHQFPRPVYPNGGFNYEDDHMDPDDQQSPTTAIIGRRPSEWMRYQQRQLQAHQAQSNRQQNDASDRYDDQQEQIRRLYLEQESQEELLRTLTARAASILEAGNAQRQTPPNTALSSSTHSLSTTQSGGTPENNERDLSSDDREGDQQNIQVRPSMLHVDTSATRPSSRQSQERSQVIEAPSLRSPETAIHRANRTDASMERDGDNQDDQVETSDDNNSIIDALQQGTRAWQRPSSLQLDLEETEQPLVLSLGEVHEHVGSDGGSPQGYSRSSLSSSSISSATPSSGVQSSTLALSSPTNTHSFSYRTSSTYSHHMTQMSSDTTFSQSSVTNQWDQPLGLQMPTLDDDGHQDEARTGSGSGPVMLEGEDGLNDNLEEMWGGTQREDVREAPSTTIDTINENHSETTGNEQTEEMGSTSVPNSMSSSTSETQHLDAYFLQSSEIQTWKSAGSSSTSGVSPMVRELDIHSPIVTTTEGSVTTIADMQIDADILARARSGSVVLSDDDEALPTTAFRAHRHNSSSVSSSPVDSPIPTPSTARPRQRFPTGIRLAGEGDEEVEQEDVDEEGQEAFEHAQEEEDMTAASLPLSPAEDVQASDNADVLEQDEHRQRDEVDDPLSNQPDTQDIQDPLSAETPNLQESVSGTTPLRSTMSSPPPLPVPLDTIESDGVDHQESSSLAAELTRAAQQQQVQTTPERSRPISVINTRRQSAQDRNESSIPTPTSRPVSTPTLAASAPQALQAQVQAQAQEEEEEEEDSPQPWPSSSSRSSATSNSPPASSSSSSFAGAARRTEDHVQYRTLVRYQPRLPKAHVMSDLISQIRVECPQRAHGCLESMEMQQMPQHGREQCRFRLVMCPRARCGLWMRADQILEHILMVEQPTTTVAPASSGPTTRPQSNKSSTRRLNRTPRQGSTKDEVHPHASSSSNSTSPSSSLSSIPPCPGLTWEREQLTRATGIIGQLTEENTSLRQMIRQLQLQNSKLVKEKDRFQRYANLVGRD